MEIGYVTSKGQNSFQEKFIMNRAFYSDSINNFLKTSDNELLGKLAISNRFFVRIAWLEEIIRYNPNLKKYARELRNNSTFAEIPLWSSLKGKQMRGYDFDMQRPIDNSIVDFYCEDFMLAIEGDGGESLWKGREG